MKDAIFPVTVKTAINITVAERMNVSQRKTFILIKTVRNITEEKMDDTNYMQIETVLEKEFGKKKAVKMLSEFYDNAFKEGREDGRKYEKKALYFKLKTLTTDLADSLTLAELQG